VHPKEERMRPVGRHEVLESVFVEMDPMLHGVRRITRRRIPLLRGEGFGRTKIETTEKEGYATETPGSTAYPEAKANKGTVACC
jgi:hypothetical protein